MEDMEKSYEHSNSQESNSDGDDEYVTGFQKRGTMASKIKNELRVLRNRAIKKQQNDI